MNKMYAKIVLTLSILFLFFSSVHSQYASKKGKIGYKSFLNSVNKYPAFGTNVEIYDNNNRLIEKSPYWKGIFENLEPGRYKVKAINSGIEEIKSVEVREDKLSVVNFFFDFNTGNIHFINVIKDVPESKAFGSITRVIHKSGETVFTGTRAEGTIENLPTGEYIVTSENGGISLEKTVEVKNNQTTDVTFEFDLGKGRLSYRCFLDSLQEKAAYGAKISIYRLPYNELAHTPFENQWRATTPFLPTGEYMVIGEYQNKTNKIHTIIYSDSTTNLNIVFDVQNIRFSFKCYRNKEKEPANGTILEVHTPDGKLVERSNGWRDTFFLAEGTYEIKANYLNKEYNFTVDLYASEGLRIEKEFILEE